MARGKSVKQVSVNEEAALRHVLVDRLSRMFPKGEWETYSTELVKSLYLQHIGPWDEENKEEEKEDNE